MPKSAWMAFALRFPVAIPCLLERVWLFIWLHFIIIFLKEKWEKLDSQLRENIYKLDDEII